MPTIIVTRKLYPLIFIYLSLGFVTPSNAQITNVQGFPQNVNIALAHASFTRLQWTTAVSYSSPGTFVSSSIIIRAGSINGPIVFTINKALSINAPQGISSHKTTETVLIPAHVTYRVRKLNMTRVFITRTFSDNSNSMTGVVIASLTGQIAARFSISLMKLRIIKSNSQYRTNRTPSIVVRATLSFNGTGTVHALWEIATTQASTGGLRKTSIFRPLNRVTRYASSGRMELLSSPLPLIYGNQYIVRLRIINPQVNNNDLPTLLYDPNIVKPGLKPKAIKH